MSKSKTQFHLTRRELVRLSALAGAAAFNPFRRTALPRAAAANEPAETFVGPFAGWSNLKTKYGAQGNGTADDTRALQNALDELGDEKNSPVLWLPAGTYRITQALQWTRNIGDGLMRIVGEHPASTKILWDGAPDGIMLQTHNVNNARFGRLTWDGQGRAAYAIQHTSSGSSSGNEHADEWFQNVGVGIRGGTMDTQMVAEMSVVRCQFDHCTRAGISIENPNAVDWWIWDSLFQDCYAGVTTGYGQGSFHVFHSVFKRSTFADTFIGFALNHVLADNYSIHSRAFCLAPFSWNPLPLVLQRNTILDPTLGANPPEPHGGGLAALFPYDLRGPIAVKYYGPLILLDNVIRSRPNQTAPVVEIGADMLAMGNVVTVPNALSAGARRLEVETSVRLPISITAAEPVLPDVPPAFAGAIFEVAVNATAAQMQTQIDAAVREGDQAVVHIPYGSYALTQGLVVLANSDIQIIGDGRTFLEWNGAPQGVALEVQAPTRVTLCDFVLRQTNAQAMGLRVTQFDQPDAHILMEHVQVRGKTYGLNIPSLDNALVELADFQSTNAFFDPPIAPERAAVHVRGGVKRAQGLETKGRLNWWSGGASGTVPTLVLEGGSAALIRAHWYEGDASQVIRLEGGGEFTMFGALLTRSDKTAVPAPAILVDNFRGAVALFGLNFADAEKLAEGFAALDVQGAEANMHVLALGVSSWGERSLRLVNSAALAQVAFLLNRSAVNVGDYVLPTADEAWGTDETTQAEVVKERMQTARRETPRGSVESQKGPTALRIYRVQVYGFDTAIEMAA